MAYSLSSVDLVCNRNAPMWLCSAVQYKTKDTCMSVVYRLMKKPLTTVTFNGTLSGTSSKSSEVVITGLLGRVPFLVLLEAEIQIYIYA